MPPQPAGMRARPAIREAQARCCGPRAEVTWVPCVCFARSLVWTLARASAPSAAGALMQAERRCTGPPAMVIYVCAVTWSRSAAAT